MSDFNVRVPPDSTGKRVKHLVQLQIVYVNKTIDFEIGATVTTPSGVVGTITHDEQDNATSGHLYINLHRHSKEESIYGEAIEINSVQHATTHASEPSEAFFIPAATFVGGNNSFNTQYVDDEGAAFVRFAEGSPQLDAFGKLQVSQQHKIAEYIQSYNELPNDFTTEITGGATLAYDANTAGSILQCGTTLGDKIVRTSDEYHTYQAGVSHLIEFTAQLSDQGKAGVLRRAGYYDDNNGVFFEMNETTFNVVLRSKSTGSVVETRVEQSAWNGDRLDGTGISRHIVDPSKDNIFWIDLQWLGAGSVRFGVIIDGVRIVAHEMKHANVVSSSYMSTATLPIRYEQENIGTAASTSEFRFFCATIKTEGPWNPFRRAFTDNNTKAVTTTSATPLMTIRPSQTYSGLDNRSSIYVSCFSIHNAGDTPIMFELWRGGKADDGAYVSNGGESTADLNKTLTSFTGGKPRFSCIVGAGETSKIDFPAFEKGRRGLRRKADITDWVELNMTAKLLSAGTGGNVTIVINWDEVRS